MFPGQELTTLAARKEQLLSESAAQRQLLSNELIQIQQRLLRLNRGASIVRRLLPLGSFAIPLIGWWRARAVSRTGSIIARIANALPIARHFAKVWRHLQRERA